jgi:hypothetical protein
MKMMDGTGARGADAQTCARALLSEEAGHGVVASAEEAYGCRGPL